MVLASFGVRPLLSQTQGLLTVLDRTKPFPMYAVVTQEEPSGPIKGAKGALQRIISHHFNHVKHNENGALLFV